MKSFTKALYGDFHLVEGLAGSNHSPLDVRPDNRWNFDSQQIVAYSRALLTTFESAVVKDPFGLHSYALARAFTTLEMACADLRKLNDNPLPEESHEITRRIGEVIHFVNDAIEILEKKGSQKDDAALAGRIMEETP